MYYNPNILFNVHVLHYIEKAQIRIQLQLLNILLNDKSVAGYYSNDWLTNRKTEIVAAQSTKFMFYYLKSRSPIS